MPRRPDARTLRDRPYLEPHLARQSDLAAQPRGFAGLLRWFLEGFWAETPETVHTAGVWFGRPPHEGADVAGYDPSSGLVVSDTTTLTGGSQLGAPKEAEPFRQLLENSPRQVAGDTTEEHYVRPMRAALERLHRRTDGDAPFMARFLYQVAYAQGDWRSVADRWFVTTPWVGRAFAEHALRRLYPLYRPAPPSRVLEGPRRERMGPNQQAEGIGWVDLSESQRAAIEAGEARVAN